MSGRWKVNLLEVSLKLVLWEAARPRLQSILRNIETAARFWRYWPTNWALKFVIPLVAYEYYARGFDSEVDRLLQLIEASPALSSRTKKFAKLRILYLTRRDDALRSQADLMLNDQALTARERLHVVELLYGAGHAAAAVSRIPGLLSGGQLPQPRAQRLELIKRAHESIQLTSSSLPYSMQGYAPECVVPIAMARHRALERTSSTIVHVSGSLGPGGAERQFLTTLEALKAAGHHRIVATVYRAHRFHKSGFYRAQLEALQIPHYVSSSYDSTENCDNKAVSDLLTILSPSQRNVVQFYLSVFRKERPRIVHLWQDDTNILGGIAALLAGVPRIILNARSLRPTKSTRYRRYLRSCYQEFLRCENIALICNSHAGARDYQDWLELEKPIEVVPNAIDTTQFEAEKFENEAVNLRRRLGIPLSAFVVGGCMRMSAVKDPFAWLEVAAILATEHEDMQFVCVGDGEQLPALRQRALEIAPRRIHFPGRATLPQPWLTMMDLLLSTSRIEGMPNALIEAQCLGKPVVATDVGGTAEVVEDGTTGFLSNSDPASLARLCTYVQTDSDLRGRLRRAGPALMHRKFSTSALVERLERLYDMALDHDARPAQLVPHHFGDPQTAGASVSEMPIHAATR